ncbi:cytidine deaminase [Shewanella maritima]|uniref:Cytidine deaminase n=1 Tax=Shewanella maritima TaxID=2520507 RepID=A0A411PD04_9GAMM|nr:cytidine deaminase [Shewanella maritima]QBF81477.1 cytidine deaminase [Shewanella maritima]
MQDRFAPALNQLPQELATAIVPILNEQFNGHISAEQLANLSEQTKLETNELLLALLPIAAALASPELSQFFVGAIVKGRSGNIYMGANLELPGEALFHTVHAEQSAISHAWLAGEKHIEAIIINFSPCGHCRQFINELIEGQDVTIHLPNQRPQKLSHYLPYAFGPADLQVTQPLLTEQNLNFVLPSDDPVIIEALEQLNTSYAPYTQSHGAVTLQMADGKILCGRYAENAAFNPSMQPMQMALTNLVRSNYQFSDIKRAVLIESAAGKISLVGAAMDALHSVAAVELEHLVAEPQT